MSDLLPPNVPAAYKDAHERFSHTPLQRRIFLTALPKTGTVLMRNILGMFVPWSEIYWSAVPAPHFLEKIKDKLDDPRYKYFHGHINADPTAIPVLRDFRHVITLRDPYDYLTSYAYWYFTWEVYNDSDFARYVVKNRFDFNTMVRLLITGWGYHGHSHLGVRDMYVQYVMSWFETGCFTIRYEELIQNIANIESDHAEKYFGCLFDFLEIDKPHDWRERIITASKREFSFSASGGLNFATKVVRNPITDEQVRLFNLVAPGLREAFGYTDYPWRPSVDRQPVTDPAESQLASEPRQMRIRWRRPAKRMVNGALGLFNLRLVRASNFHRLLQRLAKQQSRVSNLRNELGELTRELAGRQVEHTLAGAQREKTK